MKTPWIYALWMIAALAACSKQDEQTALADTQSPTVMKKETENKKAAEEPKADKNIPLERYQALDSGAQVMFSYLAISGMPVIYEDVASAISEDYRRQSDEFKKRDILTAIKPRIDEEIAKAKSNRYYTASIIIFLEKYNFEGKYFPVINFEDPHTHWYFSDLANYSYSFHNLSKIARISTPDENLARTIESIRSSPALLLSSEKQFKLLIHFFVSGTQLDRRSIRGEIVRAELKDSKGQTLVEIQ